MKKIIRLLMLVAIMMFALVGCGSNATDDTSDDSSVSQEKTESEISIEESDDLILPKLERYRVAADNLIELLISSGGSEEYADFIDEINSQYDQIKANYDRLIDMGGFLASKPEKFADAIDLQIESYESMFIELTEVVRRGDVEELLIVNYNDLVIIINELALIAEESGWLEIAEFNAELIVLHDYVDELTIKMQDTASLDEVYITESIEKTNELIIICNEYLKSMQETITNQSPN